MERTLARPIPRRQPWAGAAVLGDRCRADGCEICGGVRCNYVDRRSRPCPTSWCSSHWEIVFGRPYCRRHATVVRALDGFPAAGGWPDLDNRAASLAGWMGRQLDPAVREAFTRVAPFPGAWLVNDPVHLLLGPGGDRGRRGGRHRRAGPRRRGGHRTRRASVDRGAPHRRARRARGERRASSQVPRRRRSQHRAGRHATGAGPAAVGISPRRAAPPRGAAAGTRELR